MTKQVRLQVAPAIMNRSCNKVVNPILAECRMKKKYTTICKELSVKMSIRKIHSACRATVGYCTTV